MRSDDAKPDNWKAELKIPTKDTRQQTLVNLSGNGTNNISLTLWNRMLRIRKVSNLKTLASSETY
jgi:hypothetical protein